MTDHERDALLQKALAAKDETIASQEAVIDQLAQHNRVLQLKVDALVRRLFGKSSEKLDPAQLQMLLEGLEVLPADSPKPAASTVGLDGSEAEQKDSGQAARKKKRSFAQLVASLPIEEVIVDPAEVMADPAAFVCIGSETTKMLDHVPAQFRQQHIIRRKYVRIAQRHLPPIIAPLMRLQERCIASPRLLANVAASRFEMHLPYYRIEQLYARQGLPVPRQTLCGWMGMAHEASRLVIEQVKREVFRVGYVQIDETPVKYQDPEREGVCGTGYLWSVHNPVSNIGFMAWHTGRGSACLGQIVPQDYTGLIQSDGYKAYDSFIRQPGRAGNITLAGCMAHARRKFHEAQEEGEDARWVLAQMQALYRIEARMREARAGPLETRTARQEHSVPILAAIHIRLQSLQASRVHLPRSLTGEAIAYALGQWEKLW